MRSRIGRRGGVGGLGLISLGGLLQGREGVGRLGRGGTPRPITIFAAASLALAIATVFPPLTSSAQSGQPTGGPNRPGTAEPFDLDGARLSSIDGPITAVTLDYLRRSIDIAERDGVALVLALNTPGGDVTSMRSMAEAMLAADVPIIVWVGPQGGQAASAGTFIVLAAHAAGMAPRTTIGAASPVGSGGDDLPETVKGKITEDLSALARTFAERRGEAAVEWTEAAVRDAVSATAEEALELGLIDAVADSPAALVADLDGLTVEVGDSRHVLRTSPDAGNGSAPNRSGSEGIGSDESSYPSRDGNRMPTLSPIETTSAEQLLSLLAHPAVALLLLTLGLNAVLIELSNPGGWIPGIIGVSSLALAFYSLGVLEANFVGLAFIAGAVALFVLELKTPSSGLFTVAGLGMFIAGSVVLFSGTAFGVPWPTVIGTAGFTSLFVLFAVGAALRALARQPVTGSESLIGHRAEVKRALTPRGTVLLAGELWDAVLIGAPVAEGDAISTSSLGVPAGESVVVVDREGFVLSVRRA